MIQEGIRLATEGTDLSADMDEMPFGDRLGYALHIVPYDALHLAAASRYGHIQKRIDILLVGHVSFKQYEYLVNGTACHEITDKTLGHRVHRL